MHLEQTVHINRPAAEVFDFLLDLGNHPRFGAGIKAVRGVEAGPLALGRRYTLDWDDPALKRPDRKRSDPQ